MNWLLEVKSWFKEGFCNLHVKSLSYQATAILTTFILEATMKPRKTFGTKSFTVPINYLSRYQDIDQVCILKKKIRKMLKPK